MATLKNAMCPYFKNKFCYRFVLQLSMVQVDQLISVSPLELRLIMTVHFMLFPGEKKGAV
jgi:hypothetical protein